MIKDFGLSLVSVKEIGVVVSTYDECIVRRLEWSYSVPYCSVQCLSTRK